MYLHNSQAHIRMRSNKKQTNLEVAHGCMHAVSRALFSSVCNLIFISYISLSIFVVVVDVLLAVMSGRFAV